MTPSTEPEPKYLLARLYTACLYVLEYENLTGWYLDQFQVPNLQVAN
jgi:hypothetical protein